VGQVYGRHLQKGGARVTFFVKPAHLASLAGGVTVDPLNERTGPVRWKDFDVVTTPAEVRARRVDSLWLCVATPALEGPWLEALAAAAPEATVVSLQPGLEVSERLAARVGAERLVSGLITLISWQAPLAGETMEPPGVRYWFPPLAPAPFAGPAGRVAPLVEALRRGGFPARRVKDVVPLAAGGEAVMQPFIMALEAAGWSFAALREGHRLEVAAQAARESLTVAEALHRRSLWAQRALARAAFFRLVLALGPRLMPFPLETYLRVHFTKVGAQTRMLLDETIRLAEQHRVPHAALDELRGLLASSAQGAPQFR
jgi:2-dehydropantoate 2-reductase